MATKDEDKVLTSAKVDPELFMNAKIAFVKNKYSIRKLLETSMFFYVNDPEYRKLLHSTKI